MADRSDPSCKTYGIPLYCASIIPVNKITKLQQNKNHNHDEEEDAATQKDSSSNPDRLLILFGGGGGHGNSGVPNALVLSEFDFASKSLSGQPICRLETGEELPYRMAMHPGGDGFICAFLKSCRWFDWEFSADAQPLAFKSSERVLTKLDDVDMQLALAFNAEGSILATGGEEGHLRVFKWPSMETIFDKADAHTTVKDLAFSADSKFLVSLDPKGPCRVWDLSTHVAHTSLQRENGETFGFCKLCLKSEGNQILYVTANLGDGGYIISWSTDTWQRVGKKKITRNSICAFNVSDDGKYLAIGTPDGDIAILTSSNLQVLKSVKKAHLGIVTVVLFSQDSRALVSTSFDSTARVTLIESRKKNGLSISLVILVLFIAFLVYNFMEFQKSVL